MVVAKKDCRCGCGTIDFEATAVDLPRSTASSPVPSEAYVLDDAGQEIGGLLLFLEGGVLSSLEVYSYDEPLPLPTPDHVRWTTVER